MHSTDICEFTVSSTGGFPVPQLPLHPPAHTPAWGSGGHPAAFPTPAAHTHRLPSAPPPPTIQRTVTIPMQGHPPVFPTTMPMTGQLLNQEATPHQNLYAAQYIPHARGNHAYTTSGEVFDGNRVLRDDRGYDNIEQGSSELDHPGSEGVLRSIVTNPFSGKTSKGFGERFLSQLTLTAY
jgi:hypothetical protein